MRIIKFKAIAVKGNLMISKKLIVIFSIFISILSGPVLADQAIESWKDQVLYFVLIDRFANGSVANDKDIDKTDPFAFHGGDIKGLEKRLGYLKKLGITGLWISPVFENRPTRFFKHFAYHGYWIWNFWKTDSRFGTMAELKQLRAKLKENKIRLLLDMVVNHMDYNAPFVDSHPEWFHKDGNIEDWNNKSELENKRIFGLPDFDSDKEVVKSFFKVVGEHWIKEIAPDGFRLDAVKHVPVSFWKEFNTNMRALKGSNFFLLGELLNGNPKDIALTLRDGKFTTLFDFPLYYTLKDVFATGGDCRALGARFYADMKYPDPGLMVTFLDNHDLDRFLTSCHGNMKKYRLALGMLMTCRGIPTLCYGDEVGLEGEEGPIPENRKDMVFDDTSDLFKYVQKLIRIRKENIALRRGLQGQLFMDKDGYAFARIHADQIAVAVFNNSETSKEFNIDFPFKLKSPILRDLTANRGAVTKGNHLLTYLPPKSFYIFVSPTQKDSFKKEFASWKARSLSELAWGKRKVKFRVKAEGFSADQSLYLIGSPREMGQWSLDLPLPKLIQIDENQYEATVDLPLGAVFECKLVAKSIDGKVEWQPGGNFIAQVQERGSEYYHLSWIKK